MAFKDHWLSSHEFTENSTLKLMGEISQKIDSDSTICTYNHSYLYT